MPTIQWEWKIGPQTIISGLMLAVMIWGGIKFFVDVAYDVKLAHQEISFMQTQNVEMRTEMNAIVTRQRQVITDLADTKGKVDVILPTVQRIEDFLLRRGNSNH